jgi:predicted transposase YdaD
MNSLQKLIEQGRQEGRLEGRQEGRLEGRQEGRQEGRRETAAKMLRRLLEGRFGPLTSAQHSRIDVLDATSLEDALERILTADSIEAVIG